MADSCMRLLLVTCDLVESCLLQEAVLELTEDFRNPAGARGYELTTVDLLEDALDLLAGPDESSLHAARSSDTPAFDALLLDPQLPDCQGLPCLSRVREVAPDLPVVVLVGKDEHRLGMTFVREGAEDFLVKDEIDCEPLRRTLRYAVERARLSRTVRSSALLDSRTGCHSPTAFRLLAEHDWRVASRLRLPYSLHLIRARETSEDRIGALARVLRRSVREVDLVARLDDRTFAAVALGAAPSDLLSLGRLADAVCSRCDFRSGESIPLDQLLAEAQRRLCENEHVASRHAAAS